MAETLGVSEKTIPRYIKAIPSVRYVGKGKKWTLGSGLKLMSGELEV